MPTTVEETRFCLKQGKKRSVSQKLSFNPYMQAVAQTNPWPYTHACAQNIHSFTKGFSQRSSEHLKWKDLFTHSINPARQQWDQRMIPWILDLAEMKWSYNTPMVKCGRQVLLTSWRFEMFVLLYAKLLLPLGSKFRRLHPSCYWVSMINKALSLSDDKERLCLQPVAFLRHIIEKSQNCVIADHNFQLQRTM